MIDDYNVDEDSLLDKEIEEHNRSNALNRRLAGSSSNKVGLFVLKKPIYQGLYNL